MSRLQPRPGSSAVTRKDPRVPMILATAGTAQEQLELAYVNTVLRALEDVSNSLSTFSRAGELADSTETLRKQSAGVFAPRLGSLQQRRHWLH